MSTSFPPPPPPPPPPLAPAPAAAPEPLTAPIPVIVTPAHWPAAGSTPVSTVGAVPPPTPDSRWSFGDVFIGLGAVLLLSTLLSFLFQMIPKAPNELELWVVGFGPIWIGLVGTTWWACRRHGTGNLVQDLGFRFRPVDLALGLGFGVGLRIASIIISAFVYNLGGHSATSNTSLVTDGASGFWLVLNLILATSILAPLAEETFFRGLLMRSAIASLLRRNSGSDQAATLRRKRLTVLASAGLFAALHLSEVDNIASALTLVPALILVGVTNALLVLRTGRLGPAIITHIVFNLTAAILVLAT